MGGVCARCSDVEKSKVAPNPHAPPENLEDHEHSDEDKDDGSEVVASSDGEFDPNEYKQDVEDTLLATGANLKRGKTMAMKEAIGTAKKLGLDQTVISNAEKQLEDHKKKQKRDATEEEVVQFFESKNANEIPHAEKMLKKAQEAECSDQVMNRLQKHLADLIETRPLEADENDQAREYMKYSCTDFVVAATKGGGRPVVFVNLENGKKTAAIMSLDAPLQNLIITIEEAETPPLITSISTLTPSLATKNASVHTSKGFQKLDEADIAAAVALRHEIDNKQGVWCLVEPTSIRRDRLVEALTILVESVRALS